MATFNRAGILKKTLGNLYRLKYKNIQLQLVVVDNNSSDRTAQVCKEFENKLPLKYLFEKEPGKNRALNTAIESVELGDVVVFTDDDVSPPTDWITNISLSTTTYPEIKVFGGPVHLIWPSESPNWCKSLEKTLYAQHNYSDSDVKYAPGDYPIGPNFWLRAEIFTTFKRRYDSKIGPIPDTRKRVMGSETSFLKALSENGFEIQYIAGCSVGHYVTDDQMTPDYVRNRAKTYGRFRARVSPGFDKEKLYEKSVFLWKMGKWASLTKHTILMLIANFYTNPEKRYSRQVNACRWLAFSQTYLSSHKEIWAQHLLHQKRKNGE